MLLPKIIDQRRRDHKNSLRHPAWLSRLRSSRSLPGRYTAMGPFPSPPGSRLCQPGRAISGQVTGLAAIHQSNHQIFWSASSVNERPTRPGKHGETPTSFSRLPGPTAIIYGSPCLAAGSRSRWGCWAATSVVSPGSRNKSNSPSVNFAFRPSTGCRSLVPPAGTTTRERGNRRAFFRAARTSVLDLYLQ